MNLRWTGLSQTWPDYLVHESWSRPREELAWGFLLIPEYCKGTEVCYSCNRYSPDSLALHIAIVNNSNLPSNTISRLPRFSWKDWNFPKWFVVQMSLVDVLQFYLQFLYWASYSHQESCCMPTVKSYCTKSGCMQVVSLSTFRNFGVQFDWC